MIQLECPLRFATCFPDAVSYSAISRASPAAARYLFAGLNATARTGLTKPLSECARRLVALLNMYTLPFWWPEAVISPFGDWSGFSWNSDLHSRAWKTDDIDTHAEAALSLELHHFRRSLDISADQGRVVDIHSSVMGGGG